MTEWAKLTPTVARMAHRPGQLFVMRNQEGHNWVGQPTEILDNSITLVNGSDKETIYMAQGPFQFCVLEGPKTRSFRVGDPKLL